LELKVWIDVGFAPLAPENCLITIINLWDGLFELIVVCQWGYQGPERDLSFVHCALIVSDSVSGAPEKSRRSSSAVFGYKV